MKKLQFSAVAFTLTALMGLTACQSEEVMPALEQNATQDVVMTLDVGLGADTRTTMIEEGRNLKTIWEEGDVILVLGKDDEPHTPYGVLTMTSAPGSETATFEGHLTNVPSGRSNFTFLYAGNGASLEDYDYDPNQIPGYIIDISKQQGTLSRLTDTDVLYYRDWYTPVDGQIVVSNVTLWRNASFAHFSLKFPAGVTRHGEKITLSNTKSEGMLYTQYKLGKNSEGEYYTLNPKTPADIVIEPDAAAQAASDYNGNEVYVMFLPVADSKSFNLNFSVDIDGKTYTGYLKERDKAWTASEYVNVGAGQGVVVDMTTTATVDHSKNPLKKWSEGNAYRTSSSGFQTTAPTSGIADDYTLGSYYQWGRNYGFSSYTEAQNNYYCNSLSSTVIYRGDGTSSQVSRYTSVGVDAINNYQNMHYFLCSVQNGYSGTTNDWIYGITGTPSNYYQDTWESRTNVWTEAGNNPHPLPSDYRLPTKEEALQLVPNNFNKTKWLNGTLAEIHTIEGVKVAMKWEIDNTNSRQYLKISALVIPESVTDISKVDWTDKNVVTRIFAGNAYIMSAYGVVDIYGSYGQWRGQRYFVRPNGYFKTTNSTQNGEYPKLTCYDDCNDGRFGCYWTSESDPTTGDAWCFTYMIGGVNGEEYWIKVDTLEKDIACSVRGYSKN